MKPAGAALLAIALTAACQERSPASNPGTDLLAPRAGAETTTVSFEELYPVFLWRKSMSQGDKASLWNRYRGKWVRWEGVIASITNKGITLRQLRSTVTFDVSLTCEASVLPTLHRFQPGDRVRYVGMLDSFDDIFRTLYLSHGAVLDKVPDGDLGIPADMAHAAL
jgi:hypothetical protein